MAGQKITQKPIADALKDDAYVLVTQTETVDSEQVESLRRVKAKTFGEKFGGGGGSSGGTVEVDKTLTKSGQAADAKAAGDAVSNVKKDLSSLTTKVNQLQISGGGGIDDDLNLFAVEGETNAEKLFNALQTGGSYSGHANKMVLEYKKCTPPSSDTFGTMQCYILFRDGWAAAAENVDVVIKNTIFEPEGENAVMLQYLYAASGSITYENCTFRNVLFWFGQGAKKKIILRNCIFEDNKYQAIQCGEWNSNCEYIIEGCTFRHMRPDKSEYRADIEYQKQTGSQKINGWGHGFMRVMGYDLTMTIRDCLFYDNMGALNIMFSKSSHVDTVDPARFHLYIERCTFQKTNGSAIAFNNQPVTGWIKDCKFYNIGENRCNEEGYDFPEDKKLMFGSGTEDDPYVYACGVGGNGIFSYNWTPRHELVISGNWMYNIMENGIEGNYREVSNNHIENTGYRLDDGIWNPSTECIYGNNAIVKNNVIRNPTRGEPGIVIPSWSDGQTCVIEDNLIEFSKPDDQSESTGIEIMFQNEKFDYELFIRRNTIRGFSKKYHIYNTYGDQMPIHIEDDNDTDAPILNASDYNQRNLVGVSLAGVHAAEMVRDPYFLSYDESGVPSEWGAKAGNLAVYTNGNERFLRITGTSLSECAYIYQDYHLGADVYVARLQCRVRSSCGKIGVVPLSMQDSGAIVQNYDNRFVFNPEMASISFETDGDETNQWHTVTHSMVVSENVRIAIVIPEINNDEQADDKSKMDIKDVSVVVTRIEARTLDNTNIAIAGKPYDFSGINISYLPVNGFKVNYYIPGKTFAYSGMWKDAAWMMGKYTGGDLGRGKIVVPNDAKLYTNLVAWYKSDFDLCLDGHTLECADANTFAFLALHNGAKVNLIGQGTLKAKNYALAVSAGCECTIGGGVNIATEGQYAILVQAGNSEARTVLNIRGGAMGKLLSMAKTDINFDVDEGETATIDYLQTNGKITLSKNNKLTYLNSAGETVEVKDTRGMTSLFHCGSITVTYEANHTEEDLAVVGDESTVSYSYKDENGEIVEATGSLTDAWNAASSTADTRKNEMYIKLLDDVYTYTGLYFNAGGTITLDLNGFTIANDYQFYAMSLNGNTNLTIIDTNEREETGAITSTQYAAVIANGITLNINGGRLQQDTGIAIAATNGTAFTLSGNGELNGKIGLSAGTNVPVVIDGGTITGTQFAIQATPEEESTTSVTIHAGEITCTDGQALFAKSATLEAIEGKTATITGTIALNSNATIAPKTLVTVDGERVTALKNASGTTIISYSADIKAVPELTVSSVDKTAVALNEEITFTLNAKNTTSIRVYIDGSVNRYIYDVTDGEMTYTLSFSDAGSGTRTVAFEPCNGDVVGAKTAATTITLTNPATNIVLSASALSLEVGDAATLTATVTPANSTDSVVWSSSPSGIVSISNNTVTALSAGNATITATAGSVSATCAVTVTEATVDPDAPTLLYELPAEVTFTNTTDNIIDTGVKMFEDVSTSPQYTLLFDVTTDASMENASSKYCLLHCMNEVSPYPGLAVQTAQSGGGAPKLRIAMFGTDSSIVWNPNGKRLRIAVRIDGSTFGFAPKDDDMSMTDISIGSAYCNVPQSLLIGGYQDASGNHGRFYEGTLHSLKLYKGLMTKEECQAWVNRTE